MQLKRQNGVNGLIGWNLEMGQRLNDQEIQV